MAVISAPQAATGGSIVAKQGSYPKKGFLIVSDIHRYKRQPKKRPQPLTFAVVQHRGTRNHRDSGRNPRPTCSVTSGYRPVLFQEPGNLRRSPPGFAAARAAKTFAVCFSAKTSLNVILSAAGYSLANHPAESKDLAFVRAPNICPRNFL